MWSSQCKCCARDIVVGAVGPSWFRLVAGNGYTATSRGTNYYVYSSTTLNDFSRIGYNVDLYERYRFNSP